MRKTDQFEVRSGTVGLDHVIQVWGELDLSTSTVFGEAIDDAPGPGADRLVLDLRKVSFIDSTGVGTLLRARGRCLAQGQRLLIVTGDQQVRRLLQLTGLDRFVETARTLPGRLSGAIKN